MQLRKSATTTTEFARQVELTFAAPPEPNRFALFCRGIVSSQNGRRDARHGIPSLDEKAPPAHVKQRVDECTAFIHGELGKAYHRERTKLRNLLESMRAELDQIHNEGDVPSPTKPRPEDLPPAIADNPDEHLEREAEDGQGIASWLIFLPRMKDVAYILALAGIFACEGFVNKKAFELFSESDTYLWLMVSGLSFAVILCAHFLGQSWKKAETHRGNTVALFVLIVLALSASGMIATLRYLSIDHSRQNQITRLEGQLAAAKRLLADSTADKRRILKIAHPNVVEQNTLTTATSQIADANATIISSNTQLRTLRNPTGINDRSTALVVFGALNLFLVGVASILSYFHYDPSEDTDEIKQQRQRERQRFRLNLAESRRRRRRRRREDKRSREQARARRAAHKVAVNEIKSRNDSDKAAYDQAVSARSSRTKRVAFLNGALPAIEQSINELDRTYRAAEEEVISLHRAIIARYWSSHNRIAKRRSLKSQREWEEARRASGTNGQPEAPDDVPWKMPASQTALLDFNRLDMTANGSKPRRA